MNSSTTQTNCTNPRRAGLIVRRNYEISPLTGVQATTCQPCLYHHQRQQKPIHLPKPYFISVQSEQCAVISHFSRGTFKLIAEQPTNINGADLRRGLPKQPTILQLYCSSSRYHHPVSESEETNVVPLRILFCPLTVFRLHRTASESLFVYDWSAGLVGSSRPAMSFHNFTLCCIAELLRALI